MRSYKTPFESQVTTRYLIMPDQVNTQGTAFGGLVMSWIDMVAAMSAQKHCETPVVTASIDKLSFKYPMYIGDHVILKAQVNYVGKTSMEVGVMVLKENPITQENQKSTTAYLTFVAIDNQGNPIACPPLKPETEDDIRRYNNAKVRVQSRKELLRKIKKK